MRPEEDPRIHDIMIAAYRRMTPTEKFNLMCELTEIARQAAAARIKEQYGEMSDRELRLRLASLTVDRETMIRAFGWDPDVHGR